MRIYLLELAPVTADHWTKKLNELGHEVLDLKDIGKNDSDACAIAIVDAATDRAELHHKVEELRQLVGCVFAVDSSSNIPRTQSAFLAGVDDYVAQDVDDIILQRKLDNAQRYLRVRNQLIQSQRLESIGELAAGIAHEINTPIQYVGDNTRFIRDACEDFTSVLSACREIVESLESGQNPSAAVVRLRDRMSAADIPYLREEVPVALGQTLDGIDRVVAIVRAMKSYANPIANQPTPTNLAKLIESTITLSRNEWKYVSVIKTDLDEDLQEAECIPGQISQVILNLIVNAAHAIESKRDGNDGLEKGTISITTTQEDDDVVIAIGDNGCGIKPEVADRIFDPFFTTKQAGKGTGQGLAIAKQIIDQHQGDISICRSDGSGTVFEIRLPIRQEKSKQTTASTNRTLEVVK
ncbi:MAG: ATP-binding protein [Planctomycetota bacterium]